MNELRELNNRQLELKKLHLLTKNMSDSELDDISNFFLESSVDISPEDFKKTIKKIRIKFKYEKH
jgi:hypothetical protein